MGEGLPKAILGDNRSLKLVSPFFLIKILISIYIIVELNMISHYLFVIIQAVRDKNSFAPPKCFMDITTIAP